MLKEISEKIDKINDNIGKVICFLLLAMMISISYGVIMRYIFHSPPIWYLETSELIMACIMSLGGGYCLLHKSHVNVNIIYDKLSNRTQTYINIATNIIVLIFLSLLLYATIKFAYQSIIILEHSYTSFSPPLYPFKIILSIGIVLFILQAISEIIKNIRNLK